MKCFNCGRETERFLCPDCRRAEVLDKVFQEIRGYKPETCENPYLLDYAAGMEKYGARDAIPEILDLFPFDVAEYYYCQYFRMSKDSRLEEAAIAYLERHPMTERRSQQVLYDLLCIYLRNEFIKPQKWCAWIRKTDGLCCELYDLAAQFYNMIGEYDTVEALVRKGQGYCADGSAAFLFSNPEKMTVALEKRNSETLYYRTKRPYWPSTEVRRRAVAMFYDEKGIKYPRITSRPAKVPEDQFSALRECVAENLTDYCAFWCAEAFSLAAAKTVYQIAAVKVRAGAVVEQFCAFIRPWDVGASGRTAAAKEAGVPVETIEEAEDVDEVMPKFFAFVGEDVLVSTGALGNQAKLISRAARYTGMTEIKNEFSDLLDMAADLSDDFDLANNTREYLLAHFSIEEGRDALGKAQANQRLYEALKHFGG